MNYYNDFDPKVCAWLQAAIDNGALPAGHVDSRSITEVTPHDLKGYTQCHLFAGIGGWSVALAIAGAATPTQRVYTGQIWTVSCPCPPFSSSGKKKACPECGGTNPVPHVGRTGYFVCCTCGHEWDADGRHLWPEVWRLARDCGPELILGEQVASADGRVWLTSVRASLEILGYTPWGADISAAGAGAPHIRQRLYWVAHAKGSGSGAGLRDCGQGQERGHQFTDGGGAERLADPERLGDCQQGGKVCSGRGTDNLCSPNVRMANTSSRGCGELRCAQGYAGQPDQCHTVGGLADAECHQQRQGRGTQCQGSAGDESGPEPCGCSSVGGLADAQQPGLEGYAGDGDDGSEPGWVNAESPRPAAARGPAGEYRRPGPHDPPWRAVDWLKCRDDKWRPVEPGTFPLADGVPNRMVKIRGYGNAIDPWQAAAFIGAVM